MSENTNGTHSNGAHAEPPLRGIHSPTDITEQEYKQTRLRTAQQSLRILEGFADFYGSLGFTDPRDVQADLDGYGWYGAGYGMSPPPYYRQSQKRGEVIPVYVNEIGLRFIRDRSRRLCQESEFAIAAIENRKNYLVGKGLTYRAAAKHQKCPPALVDKVQKIIDAFVELNDLSEIERDVVHRMDCDGEAFLRCFELDSGLITLRQVEPEHVRSPIGDSYGPEYSFGIETYRHDIETRRAYWIVENPIDNPMPSRIPANDIIHFKLNTNRTAKRGLPTFYPVEKNLRDASDLLTSMTTMAKTRAKIALIRKFKGVTQSAAQALINNVIDATVTDPSVNQTLNMEKLRWGSILNSSDNIEYDMPSADVDASSFVAVLETEIRAIAARVQMPDWMLLATANTSSYASALVAESPSTRAFEAAQHILKKKFGETRYHAREAACWKQLRVAVRKGFLPREVFYLIDIQVECPTLVTRDKYQESQWNGQYLQAGIKSPQTISQELGLDYEQEQRNFAEAKKSGNQAGGGGEQGGGPGGPGGGPAGPGGGPQGGPDQGTDDDGWPAPTAPEGVTPPAESRPNEALREDWDETKHKRGQPGNKGQFGSGGGGSSSGGKDDAAKNKPAKKGSKETAPAQATATHPAIDATLKDWGEKHEQWTQHLKEQQAIVGAEWDGTKTEESHRAAEAAVAEAKKKIELINQFAAEDVIKALGNKKTHSVPTDDRLEGSIATRAWTAAYFVGGAVAKLPGDPARLPKLLLAPTKDGERAHCEKADFYGRPVVRLDTTDDTSTAVHELGHYIEFHVPGVMEATQEFLAERVGKETAKPMAKLFKSYGYDADELGRKDKFDKYFDKSSAYYVGKDYGGQATEVLSMGLEALHRDPINFMKKDHEYASFVLRILDGTGRKKSDSADSTSGRKQGDTEQSGRVGVGESITGWDAERSLRPDAEGVCGTGTRRLREEGGSDGSEEARRRVADGSGTGIEERSHLLEEKDASGHEHAKDGKFGSGGSGTATAAKPASTDHEDAEHHLKVSRRAMALGDLEAEVGPEIEKSDELKSIFSRVSRAVGSAVRTLYLNELPAWALEHVDVWTSESAMNASQPGGTMAVKVAAYAAVKAWQAVKKLAGKVTEAEQVGTEHDFDTVVAHVHDAMAQIGKAAGFPVPSIEDVATDLEERRSSGDKTEIFEGLSRLIKKRITYRRNGKTFERDQWVRAHEEPGAGEHRTSAAGKPPSSPRAKKDRPTLDLVRTHLEDIHNAGTPEKVAALAGVLSQLTVAELHEIKSEMGVWAGGKKPQLAEKLARLAGKHVGDREHATREARKAGIKPKALFAHAREVRKTSNEHVDSTNLINKRAREMYADYNGKKLRADHPAFKDGDHTQLGHFDEIVRDLANEFPEAFPDVAFRHDTGSVDESKSQEAAQKAYDILAAGKLSRVKFADSYRLALNYMSTRQGEDLDGGSEGGGSGADTGFDFGANVAEEPAAAAEEDSEEVAQEEPVEEPVVEPEPVAVEPVTTSSADVAVKEPHEMTRAEFTNTMYPDIDNFRHEPPGPGSGETYRNLHHNAYAAHRKAIRAALQSGLTVPDNVLGENSDLAHEYPAEKRAERIRHHAFQSLNDIPVGDSKDFGGLTVKRFGQDHYRTRNAEGRLISGDAEKIADVIQDRAIAGFSTKDKELLLRRQATISGDLERNGVRRGHAEKAAAALAAGKPVPPEVLADYPDLAAKASSAPAVPTAPTAPAKPAKPEPDLTSPEAQAAIDAVRGAKTPDAWKVSGAVKAAATPKPNEEIGAYLDKEGNWTHGTIPAGAARTGQEWLAQQSVLKYQKAKDDLAKVQADTRTPAERVKKMGNGWWADQIGGSTVPSPFKSKKDALAYLEKSDQITRDNRAEAIEDAKRDVVETHKNAGKPVPPGVIAEPTPTATPATPPEPGFTGIDAHGHRWENGVQKAIGDEAGAAQIGKGAMSKPEAEKAVADSALKDTFYHATTPEAAAAISKDGFTSTGKKYGKVFGDGVYLATDAPTTDRYAKQVGAGASVVEVKVNVKNPFVVKMEDLSDGFLDIAKRLPGGEAAFRKAQEKMVKDGVSHDDSRGKAIAAMLQDAGYDALKIEASPDAHHNVGGSQLVVFDPKNVVAVAPSPASAAPEKSPEKPSTGIDVSTPGQYDTPEPDTKDTGSRSVPRKPRVVDPDKPKLEYVRAPAGGKVSDVDGKFYHGGQLMPIHGKYSGMEKSEPRGQEGDATPPAKPDSEGKGSRRQPAQPLTPEEIEEKRARFEDQKKWDEVNAGPLGQMKWFGNVPNSKAFQDSVLRLSEWKDLALKIGEPRLKALADQLKAQNDAWVDNDVAAELARTGVKIPEENIQWEKDQARRSADDDAQLHGSKKHSKEVPSSFYVRQLLQQALGHAKTVDDVHQIHQILKQSTVAPATTPTSGGQK